MNIDILKEMQYIIIMAARKEHYVNNKELNDIFDEFEDEEFDGSYKKTLHQLIVSPLTLNTLHYIHFLLKVNVDLWRQIVFIKLK